MIIILKNFEDLLMIDRSIPILLRDKQSWYITGLRWQRLSLACFMCARLGWYFITQLLSRFNRTVVLKFVFFSSRCERSIAHQYVTPIFFCSSMITRFYSSILSRCRNFWFQWRPSPVSLIILTRHSMIKASLFSKSSKFLLYWATKAVSLMFHLCGLRV